jgi:mevalonate kinase
MTESNYQASAPGKVILLGEHSVVYGRSAIAIPVSQSRAEVTITILRETNSEIFIDAPAIHIYKSLEDLPARHPLHKAINLTIETVKPAKIPAMKIHINSSLPIGGGMGSGAAVSCALIRALSKVLAGQSLDEETVNNLVFEVEKIHHANPSGVDNTVITYETPVLFRKGNLFQFLEIGQPLDFLIADTGINSSTSVMVEGVRKQYDKNTKRFETIFDHIENLVQKSVIAIKSGNPEILAENMNRNHELLQEIGVSSFSLDRLVKSAREAGGLGAKLTGAGGGGSILALVTLKNKEAVENALRKAGAVKVIPFSLQQG